MTSSPSTRQIDSIGSWETVPQPDTGAANRRRVRLACLECRGKKVRCDGARPCARCTSYKAVCAYAQPQSVHPGPCSPKEQGLSNGDEQAKILASRMTCVETLLRQVLENIPAAKNTAGSLVPQQITQQQPVSSNSDVFGRSTPSEPSCQAASMQELLAAVDADMSYTDNESIIGVEDEESGLREERNDGDNQAIEGPELDAEYPTPQTFQNPNDVSSAKDLFYADGLGELDADNHGQLRYRGLGSTAPVAVENCIGLRLFITRSLKQKGFEVEEHFLGSPETTQAKMQNSEETTSPLSPVSVASLLLPPTEVVNFLLASYSRHLGRLVPLIDEAEIRSRYEELVVESQSYAAVDMALLFAVLAVAIPLVDLGDDVFTGLDARWRTGDIGGAFFQQAMDFVDGPMSHAGQATQNKTRSQDMVVTLTLLSIYHAETSSLAEAWIMLGRAIRIAQDIGLHRSPKRLRLPQETWGQRRNVWWCLYILERQLCTALGRPLSINDDDCDTEMPVFDQEEDGHGLSRHKLSAFASMIHLHRIHGKILRIVNSPGCGSLWDGSIDDLRKEELRSQVLFANEALRTWARDRVPTYIKMASPKQHGEDPEYADKQQLLSAFFSAVMLLYRAFMRNPHRPGLLTGEAGSQAQLRSAKAATDCIRGASDFFRCVPRGHTAILHGQYVFVSALVLLSCVRWSDDPKFVFETLKAVEQAMGILDKLRSFWSGALKCRASVAEYLDFTFRVLAGDRRCHFQCPRHRPVKRSTADAEFEVEEEASDIKRRRRRQKATKRSASRLSPSLALEPSQPDLRRNIAGAAPRERPLPELQRQRPPDMTCHSHQPTSTMPMSDPTLESSVDFDFDGGIEQLLGALHPDFVMLEEPLLQLRQDQHSSCATDPTSIFPTLELESTGPLLQGLFFN